jgi:Glycosyltransferase family 87
MQAKYHYITISIVLAAVFSFCIWRDVKLEKQYPADLRNRVVGARLQMDGRPPYFYKWKPVDGLRYYDPIQADTTYANAITASPFLHHLLFPIANLPQRQISRIWLGVEYCLFFFCILLAFSFTKNTEQQWAVTITGALFLFTEAWLTHIYYGQNYILFPFLSFAFLFFFQRKDHLVFPFLAGLAAVILFLARPTTALFFLPFLFLLKKYSYKYLFVFFVPVLILLSYSLLNKNERSFWLDYRHAIAAHITDEQRDDHAARTLAFKPVMYQTWEGWDQSSIKKAEAAYPAHLTLEYAGVPHLAKAIFHTKIPLIILNFCFAAIMALLMIIFFRRHMHDPSLHIALVAIFGFCLYMLSDFFSPVLRRQYYTLQWIFPLLLCAAFYNQKLRTLYVLLTAGLLLNILNTPYIKIRHTIGEYLILFTLLWMCLSRQSRLSK